MSDPGPIDPAEARRVIVAEWVSIAEGDMDVAQRLLNDEAPVYRVVAFHFQQAIEKVIKALLIERGVRPPKTHDLELLRELLSQAGVGVVCAGEELKALSGAAVETRYPGPGVSPELARDLHRIASQLWAQLRPLI